jgi:SPP1 family predicted phage head-tail adaptor
MGHDTTLIAARRRWLVIEAPALSPDDAGGAAESFTILGRAWGAVRWLSGDERWRADRFEQAGRCEITLRWRAGITAGMRLRDGARIYAIRAAGDPTGARTQLVCLCEEITP